MISTLHQRHVYLFIYFIFVFINRFGSVLFVSRYQDFNMCLICRRPGCHMLLIRTPGRYVIRNMKTWPLNELNAKFCYLYLLWFLCRAFARPIVFRLPSGGTQSVDTRISPRQHRGWDTRSTERSGRRTHTSRRRVGEESTDAFHNAPTATPNSSGKTPVRT